MPIANELVEALARVRIPGESGQVLWALLRLTYGWQKKEDVINLRQLMDLTRLKKPTICRALSKMITMNIIIKKDNAFGTMWGLQKNYDLWKPLSKKITLSKKIINVIKKDNKPLSKKITPNTTTFKDIFKERKTSTTFAPNDKKHRSGAPTPSIPKIDFDFSIKKWTGITETDIVDWQAAYPACNVTLEIDRAGLWLLSNPTKRKQNYRRFITNWLVRTQEKGGTR